MLMHPVLPTQGHDTVSTLLMWILMELGRRPALQERLRSEVDAALGDEVADQRSGELACCLPACPPARLSACPPGCLAGLPY
jgi:cytochrome P450